MSSVLMTVSYLVLVLALLLLCTCATSTESSTCKKVCGLREDICSVEFQAKSFLPSLPFQIQAGNPRCKEPFKKWGLVASNFLQLLNGGLNETTSHNHSQCPSVHYPVRFRPRDAQFRTHSVMFDGGSLGPPLMNFFENTSSATRCDLFFSHYIVKKSKAGRKHLLWIKANTAQDNGTIIALINATSGFPVPVNDGSQPRPCPLSSCPQLSAFWRGHQPYKNSMFANFTDRQVPGLRNILTIIEANLELVGNLQSDLSASNLAILALPLALAIPPISLLEKVSPMTTVTYVVATDILAALPLLIKGIELLVAIQSRPDLQRYTAISIGTDDLRIFENFYVHCVYEGIVNPNTAALIIAVALWSMVASIYVEFLFWRSKQEDVLRRVELVSEEDHFRYTNEEDLEPDANSTRIAKLKEILWEGKRKWLSTLITLLAGSYIFHLFVAALSYSYSRYSMFPFSVFLVITHLVLSNQTPVQEKDGFWSHPSSQNKASNETEGESARIYLLGIGLGFIGGPLYILLAVLHNKMSKKIMVGGNIGVAYLVLILAVVFGQWPVFRVELYGTLFAWVYGIAVILSQIAQSDAKELAFWKYSVMGWGLGMLFGPFGFLFIRIFPENHSDRAISTKLKLGCAYGVMFCIVSLFPLAYALRTNH